MRSYWPRPFKRILCLPVYSHHAVSQATTTLGIGEWACSEASSLFSWKMALHLSCRLPLGAALSLRCKNLKSSCARGLHIHSFHFFRDVTNVASFFAGAWMCREVKQSPRALLGNCAHTIPVHRYLKTLPILILEGFWAGWREGTWLTELLTSWLLGLHLAHASL